MIITKLLLSITLVFIALGLSCAVWASRPRREPGLGRHRDTPAGPAPFGTPRAELEALTARARARAARDPQGLRRPLFFRSVRMPSGADADGGDPIQTGFSAVRPATRSAACEFCDADGCCLAQAEICDMRIGVLSGRGA